MCDCGAGGGEPHKDGCPRWAEILKTMDPKEAKLAEKNRRINLDRFKRGLPVPYSAYPESK